jgi:hypothetical protein
MGWLEDKLTGEERLTGAACAGWRVGDRWTGSWRGDNNIDLIIKNYYKFYYHTGIFIFYI